MKKSLYFIFILFFAIPFISTAQQFGISIGYGTSKAIYFDVLFGSMPGRFHIGGTYQFSDTRGKLVEEQLANYGRTVDGTGSYYYALDFGYGYQFKGLFLLGGELSIGSRSEFTNYLDGRFSGGGYHMVDESNIIAGIGANLGAQLSSFFELFGGYNTLRKVTFGIRILL